VLVRHTHWPWIAFCLLAAGAATGVWWLVARDDPRGLNGGSTFGLWCGVLGSLCMGFAGVLPLLRRKTALTSRWIPPRAWWLQGHIWIGLLSVLFIWFHSGFRLAGTLTGGLTIIFFIVIASGVLGLVLQAFLPRRMTLGTSHEVPPAQVGAICAAWREEARKLLADLPGPGNALGEASTLQGRLAEFHQSVIEPGLEENLPARWPWRTARQVGEAFAEFRSLASPSTPAETEAVDRLEAICLRRIDLARQQRRFAWLHAWLPVHIALSVALLVLGLVHIVTALYY
jgi:hypothetical protein